jgi:hypothetical protein
MAKQVFKDGRVLVGGEDFSGQYNSIDFSINSEMQDATVFNSTTRVRVPTLTDFTMNLTGFYSASTATANSTSSTDEASFDSVNFADIGSTVDKILTLAANTMSTGDIAYFMKGVKASYDIGGAVGDLMKGDSVFQAKNSQIVRGTVAIKDVPSTDSVNGPATELGAVSTAQDLFAVLHVTRAGSTTGTLDVIITSDTASTFPSASTRLTFTQVTGPTAEFLSVGGAITDTEFRAELTIGGAAPDFDAYVVFGVV